MDHLVAELQRGIARYDSWGWPRPDVTLVSGSGLAVDLPFESSGRRPLNDLLPWRAHGIVGHPMEVELLTTPRGRRILYYRGRLHGYQGYTAAQVVYPIRLARLLGAGELVMTNAAGAVDASYPPGSLVLLADHLNLMGKNPLEGEPPAEWGPRFPDMVRAHDPGLRERIRAAARELDLELLEGVYAGLAGPSYETPAEVRMLGTLGAHVVGMSTVLEVIAAHHMGMRCAVVSTVANLGAGLSGEVLQHDEVLEIGRETGGKLRKLFVRLFE
jgi:purine-nucleoside phosphorylase